MKLFFGIITLALAYTGLATSPPPALFPAPQFSLIDQNDKPFTDADLKGKVWMVDFIFTRCGGPCPLMTQKMIQTARQISNQDVRFVSITVDPDFDRPAVLRQYAKDQGATDPRFIFLTGDAKTIYALANKGFMLSALPAKEDAPIIHDERFLLVSGGGAVMGIYHSNDPASMARLPVEAIALAAPVPTAPAENPWLARFPAINASLNASAGLLICIAMIFIQAKKVRAHAYTMIAAVICSALFLACYLTYHYMKGPKITSFPQSSWRPVYLSILISHTILAVVILPMIVMTLLRAYQRKWQAHRKIARPTFWIWLYVSVTGVVVYWMLYHFAPTIVTVPV